MDLNVPAACRAGTWHMHVIRSTSPPRTSRRRSQVRVRGQVVGTFSEDERKLKAGTVITFCRKGTEVDVKLNVSRTQHSHPHRKLWQRCCCSTDVPPSFEA